mmetsp:Transcript_34406/g.109242  ORF Transcript_34406/g.109242 Transcript_34406/m.109242 type:complete len:298 (-) Transcript_34406:808-1701(-)
MGNNIWHASRLSAGSKRCRITARAKSQNTAWSCGTFTMLCSPAKFPLAQSSFSLCTWSSLLCRTPIICWCCAEMRRACSRLLSTLGLRDLCEAAGAASVLPHVEATARAGAPVMLGSWLQLALASPAASGAAPGLAGRAAPRGAGRSAAAVVRSGVRSGGTAATRARRPRSSGARSASPGTARSGTAAIGSAIGSSLQSSPWWSPSSTSSGARLATCVCNFVWLVGPARECSRPYPPPALLAEPASRLWRSATQMPSCGPSVVMAMSFSSGKHRRRSWRPRQSTSRVSKGAERASAA